MWSRARFHSSASMAGIADMARWAAHLHCGVVPVGATVGPRAAMRDRMAAAATQQVGALGWRPGPEGRVAAVGLSGVALGISLRHGALAPRVARVRIGSGFASGSGSIGTASVTAPTRRPCGRGPPCAARSRTGSSGPCTSDPNRPSGWAGPTAACRRPAQSAIPRLVPRGAAARPSDPTAHRSARWRFRVLGWMSASSAASGATPRHRSGWPPPRRPATGGWPLVDVIWAIPDGSGLAAAYHPARLALLMSLRRRLEV